MKGQVIVIEGIDHSFKETGARNLASFFRIKGYKVLPLSFPNYNTEIGQEIYKILHEGTDEEKESLPRLFHKEQVSYIDTIQEAVNSGFIVIIDRYFPSNIAYNYTSSIIGLEERFAGLIDYTLYFDMDPDLIKDLIKERAKKNNEELDMNESDIEKLKKVRVNYLKYIATRANTDILGQTAIIDTYDENYNIRSETDMRGLMSNICDLISGR